uniref:Uncharacterized protein n=1 Tax=Anguilla anguilla TaxID=7936 RepID=A0A0E9WQW8_ANGAN
MRSTRRERENRQSTDIYISSPLINYFQNLD